MVAEREGAESGLVSARMGGQNLPMGRKFFSQGSSEQFDPNDAALQAEIQKLLAEGQNH